MSNNKTKNKKGDKNKVVNSTNNITSNDSSSTFLHKPQTNQPNCPMFTDANDVNQFQYWNLNFWNSLIESKGEAVVECIKLGTIDGKPLPTSAIPLDDIHRKVQITNYDLYEKYQSDQFKLRIKQILDSFQFSYYLLSKDSLMIPDDPADADAPILPTTFTLERVRTLVACLSWDQLAYDVLINAEDRLVIDTFYDKVWAHVPKTNQDVLDTRIGDNSTVRILDYQKLDVIDSVCEAFYHRDKLVYKTEMISFKASGMTESEYSENNLNPQQIVKLKTMKQKDSAANKSSKDEITELTQRCISAFAKIGGTAKDIISVELSEKGLQRFHLCYTKFINHYNAKGISDYQNQKEKLYQYKTNVGESLNSTISRLRQLSLGYVMIMLLKEWGEAHGDNLAGCILNQTQVEANWGSLVSDASYRTKYVDSKILKTSDCCDLLQHAVADRPRFKKALDTFTLLTPSARTYDKLNELLKTAEDNPEGQVALEAEIRTTHSYKGSPKPDPVANLTENKPKWNKNPSDNKEEKDKCDYCDKKGYFNTSKYNVPVHPSKRCWFNPNSEMFRKDFKPRLANTNNNNNNNQKSNVTQAAERVQKAEEKKNKRKIDELTESVNMLKKKLKKVGKSKKISKSSGEESEDDDSSED